MLLGHKIDLVTAYCSNYQGHEFRLEPWTFREVPAPTSKLIEYVRF